MLSFWEQNYILLRYNDTTLVDWAACIYHLHPLSNIWHIDVDTLDPTVILTAHALQNSRDSGKTHAYGSQNLATFAQRFPIFPTEKKPFLDYSLCNGFCDC